MKKWMNVLLVAALAAVAAAPAMAGTDTTFSVAVTKLTGFLNGSGGMLVAIMAVIAAAIAGISGNIKTALSAMGVAVLASVGPSVAGSFFTAVLV